MKTDDFVEQLEPVIGQSAADVKLQKLFQSYYTELFDGRMPLSKFNQLVEQARFDRGMTRDQIEYFIRRVKSTPKEPTRDRFNVIW